MLLEEFDFKSFFLQFILEMEQSIIMFGMLLSIVNLLSSHSLGACASSGSFLDCDAIESLLSSV